MRKIANVRAVEQINGGSPMGHASRSNLLLSVLAATTNLINCDSTGRCWMADDGCSFGAHHAIRPRINKLMADLSNRNNANGIHQLFLSCWKIVVCSSSIDVLYSPRADGAQK